MFFFLFVLQSHQDKHDEFRKIITETKEKVGDGIDERNGKNT